MCANGTRALDTRTMKMHRVVASLVLFLSSACAPSMQYTLGQGYYSDKYSKAQLQEATMTGRTEHLGRVSTSGGGCFLYSQESADRNVVIPAVQDRLVDVGGDAADKIAATEKGWDILLSVLVVPGILGCSSWNVAFDALKIAPVSSAARSPAVEQPDVTDARQPDERLRRVQELFDQGLIDEKEYKDQRAKILRGL